MITYSCIETITELARALSNIDTIYKEDCINWSGKKMIMKLCHIQINCRRNLKNLTNFEEIKAVTRVWQLS